MKTTCLLPCCLLLLCTAPQANDFPTEARVEFVIDCMNKKGEQSYNTLYPCVCTIDKIASGMPYQKYEYAQTMSVMIRTPGERGGAFRDAPGARKLVKEYNALLKSAEDSCIVKQVRQ